MGFYAVCEMTQYFKANTSLGLMKYSPGGLTPGETNGISAIWRLMKKSVKEVLKDVMVRPAVIARAISIYVRTHLPRKATTISLRRSSRAMKP